MDITTKKGKQGRKNIDRITVEKGRRGDFSPPVSYTHLTLPTKA